MSVLNKLDGIWFSYEPVRRSKYGIIKIHASCESFDCGSSITELSISDMRQLADDINKLADEYEKKGKDNEMA